MTNASIHSSSMSIINFSYLIKNRPLFNHLNATFTPGITAILGDNGSGKSTLLKILSGLLLPTKGEVLWQGKNIFENRCWFHTKMGYVPPMSFLYPHLTVMENLFFVSKLKACQSKLIKNLLTIILDTCNLNQWQTVLYSQLSDGVKKRVSMACALLHDPQLLILDEPCSSLDPTQRKNLWDLFARLRTQGKTIIFSSHHVTEIPFLCDNIFLLKAGLLKAQTDQIDQTNQVLAGDA